MCLAIPGKISEIINEHHAVISVGGIRKTINISLLPDIQVGEYAIVHVGFALHRLDEDEAEKTLQLLHEAGDIQQALSE